MTAGAEDELRPSLSASAALAVGVGAPVIFGVFLVGIVVTAGSAWAFAWAAVGLGLALVRATRLAVRVTDDRLLVRNFYGSRVIMRRDATGVEPFSYRVNPNLTCLAVVTSKGRQPLHATYLPSAQRRYESAARSFAARLGLPTNRV